jgi:hypothetical protein
LTFSDLYARHFQPVSPHFTLDSSRCEAAWGSVHGLKILFYGQGAVRILGISAGWVGKILTFLIWV